MSLSMREDEIQIVRDADFASFSRLLKENNLRIVNNNEAGKKTLVFMYYGGHGIMKFYTKAVCNRANNARQVFYPLESQLRTLGS